MNNQNPGGKIIQNQTCKLRASLGASPPAGFFYTPRWLAGILIMGEI